LKQDFNGSRFFGLDSWLSWVDFNLFVGSKGISSCGFTSGAFPIISIYSPICIRVSCKHKICFSRKTDIIINSGIYVLDDVLDNSKMRFLWISLESSTNSDTESNIWSACRKIEKIVNHTSVKNRIYLFAC